MIFEILIWFPNFFLDDFENCIVIIFIRNDDGIKVKQVSVFTNENPSAVLTGLQPYKAYQITVSAVNNIGTSLASQPSDIFYTDSEGKSISRFH